MKIRKLIKFRRIPRKYKIMSIFSYITIVFVLMAFAVSVIAVYDSEMKKTTSSFNNYILTNVVSSFEDGIWSMKNFQKQLLLNEYLQQVVASETKDYFALDSTWSLLEDLKAYADYDDKIDLFFVYLKRTDQILFQNGIVDAELFYNAYFAETGITFEDWKTLIANEKGEDSFAGSSFADENGQPVEAVMLVGSIPGNLEQNSFVIYSRKQNFMGGLVDVTWEAASDIYIYNIYGRLMLYEKKVNDDYIPGTLDEIKKYEDNAYQVFIQPLSMREGNWYLASRIPKYDLNLRVSMLQMISLAGAFCALVIIILFIKYFVKLNYRPVERLVELFGAAGKKGEFEFLYDSIVDTIGEKKKVLENLKALENRFQTAIIPQAIHGNLSPKMLDEYHSYFEDRQYILSVFHLENISSLFSEDEEMSNFEREYHLSYILNNVMQELFSEYDTDVFFASVDTFDLCIVNLKDGCTQEQIRQTVSKGMEFINGHFNLQIEAGFSEVCEGFLGLSSAFEKIAEGFKSAKTKNERYSFSIYKERGLVQCIKVGNKEAALEIVHALLSETESKAERSYFNIVALDIMSTILKILSESEAETFDLEEVCDFYKKINSSLNSTEKVALVLEDYVRYACGIFSEGAVKKNTRSHVRAEEIQIYIAENFMDCNLSLSMIADHFGLSRPHLSKIFKETLGMTVLNYINNVRMEYAERLIQEGRYSLNEIAQMAGFGNVRSLYRLRKKNKE